MTPSAHEQLVTDDDGGHQKAAPRTPRVQQGQPNSEGKKLQTVTTTGIEARQRLHEPSSQNPNPKDWLKASHSHDLA